MNNFLKSHAFALCAMIVNAVQPFTVTNNSGYEIEIFIFQRWPHGDNFDHYKKWIYPERFDVNWLSESKKDQACIFNRGLFSIVLKQDQIATITMGKEVNDCNLFLCSKRNRNGNSRVKELWFVEIYDVAPDDMIKLEHHRFPVIEI